MLSTLTSDPSTLLLLLVLSIAVITDISQQRIPNLLTFSAAGTGLLLHTYQHGWGGLAASLMGIMIGFLALLPFYLAQGMRAGDLKLMAACGAFLGFHTPLAIGFSLLVGMVLGLAVLGWRGGGKAWFSRYWVMFMLFASTGKWSYQPPVVGEVAATSFPYAAAIACGSLLALYRANAG